MAALTPAELPELMAAIANASIKRTTRCLLEWQLHTMTRPAEASGARWNEINWDEKIWTIPAERMKKKRAPHPAHRADAGAIGSNETDKRPSRFYFSVR